MTIRTLHCIAGRVGYCICDVCKYVEKGSGSRKVADDPTLLFGGVGWKMTTENQRVHPSIRGTFCVNKTKTPCKCIIRYAVDFVEEKQNSRERPSPATKPMREIRIHKNGQNK